MSRKNHNSVLFLTTLGVYLGLVLVGATPQVLAQAAIQIEEQAGSPFNCGSVNVRTRAKGDFDIAEALIPFFLQLKSCRANSFTSLGEEIDCSKAWTGSGGASGSCRFSPQGYFALFETADSLLNSLNNTPLLRLSGRYPASNDTYRFRQLSAALIADSSEFSLSILFDQQTNAHASALAVRLTEREAGLILRESEPLRKFIREHTQFRAENDQVFIVTRLPRAGLDALLASNAK